MLNKRMAILIAAGLCISSGAARADDYKKTYCSNNEYVAGGSKYPHLHCDKSFLVYSTASNKHTDLARGDAQYCESTRKVIDDIKAAGPTRITGYTDVLNDTLAFARVYCKKT